MSFLSRLRIGQRLTLSYTLLILLLIVIGAYGAHNASRLSHDLDQTAALLHHRADAIGRGEVPPPHELIG